MTTSGFAIADFTPGVGAGQFEYSGYARPQAAFPAALAQRRPCPTTLPGSRTTLHDPRWPAICAALQDLRDTGRCSVRIVDADCGAGSLLLHAAHHARTLGFTAIEGRGIDGSPALIGRARALAARARDWAVGLTFEVADMADALRDECECPADIVLWQRSSGPCDRPGIDALIERAGEVAVDEGGATYRRTA